MMHPEDIFGPPMAAPESAAMRRLRFAFIALATLTAAGVAMIGMLADVCGRPGAGGLLALLVIVTALVGMVWLRTKTWRDDRWILSRCFDAEGADQ